MRRMSRKEGMAAIRAAGWHSDIRAAVHAYLVSPISIETYASEFFAGVKARKNGETCNCIECTTSPDVITALHNLAGPSGTTKVIPFESRAEVLDASI